MSLTVTVKGELALVATGNAAQRRAEVSVMLRFAGGPHIVSERIVIEVELGHGRAVRRLHQHLKELYGMEPEAMAVQGGSLHRGFRYVLRVTKCGKDLARLPGLVDDRGRLVRGMSVSVIQGGCNTAAAARRGAFLARGSPTKPGRSSSSEATCPGSEAALALVGAAWCLDISAKAREVHRADRAVVRDDEAIGVLLERMGAPETFKVWAECRSRRESWDTANRLANFDDANPRHSTRAVIVSGARVERAFEILGDDVPVHLLQAGRLCIAYKQVSLEELGQLSDPQLTKGAVVGRIRRLLTMAGKQAHELGIPDTESVLTQEMLEP